jgi:hypothetical protein
MPSPKLAAPLSRIELKLTNFRIQYDFQIVIPRFNKNLSRNLLINFYIDENFYSKFRFKLVKFINFETLSPNFAAPSSRIWLYLI